MKIITRLTPVFLLFTSACGDVEAPEGCHYHGDHLHCEDENHGLATTVRLLFTPDGGGEPLAFEWTDPENDGEPIIDDIVLPDDSDTEDHVARGYTLDVEIWNALEDPVEDVTPDIAEQANMHQVFFTGSAVQGPATGDNPDAIIAQAYADEDANGLPLGLSNTVTTLAWGSGELTVTLRHMPTENGELVKTPDLAADVAEGGFSAIGGSNDIEVKFNIEVE